MFTNILPVCTGLRGGVCGSVGQAGQEGDKGNEK